MNMMNHFAMTFGGVALRCRGLRFARTRRTRGTITHEATMAIVIATAAIVGTVQILAVISQQRREAELRSVATRETGNLLEEIAARPWSDLTHEKLAALALSDECQSVLRDPRLGIHIQGEADGAGKHVTVEIDWLTGSQQRAAPERAALWRYPSEEAN